MLLSEVILESPFSVTPCPGSNILVGPQDYRWPSALNKCAFLWCLVLRLGPGCSGPWLRNRLSFKLMATCPLYLVCSFLSFEDMQVRGRSMGQTWFLHFPTRCLTQSSALGSYVILSTSRSVLIAK